jgi:D-lactate dehydrogenase
MLFVYRVARCVASPGLDVYENEGSLFFEDFSQSGEFNYSNWDGLFSELEALPNVLVSPHSAFLTYEALKNISETVVMNLSELAEGKPLTNEVKGRPPMVSSMDPPSDSPMSSK